MLSVPRLLLLLPACLAACGPPPTALTVTFEARAADAPLACDGGDLRLTDLRFFVHDLVLVGSDGRAAPVAFERVPGWQSADVALVDLEDGSGACLNGTPARRAVVTGQVAAGNYAELRFVVGVPASLNHGNPLTAEPPLTRTDMHWHWRSGYKFLRAGIANDNDGAWLHLGSARCRGASGALAGCAAANRATVAVPVAGGPELRVIVDLAQLFAATDLADGRAASCQAGPDEPLCPPVYRALGIDPASGASVAPAAVFRGGTGE